MLTSAQRATLKTFVLADPTLSVLAADGNMGGLADALNADAAPTFTVWKTSVPRNDVGKVFEASALAAITTGNNDKLNNFAQWNDTVYPYRADQRAFFDDVFSVAAGATTRANLLAFWKRTASVVEKLFATGTGSDGSPATLGTGENGVWIEGDIGYTEVILALSE